MPIMYGPPKDIYMFFMSMNVLLEWRCNQQIFCCNDFQIIFQEICYANDIYLMLCHDLLNVRFSIFIGQRFLYFSFFFFWKIFFLAVISISEFCRYRYLIELHCIIFVLFKVVVMNIKTQFFFYKTLLIRYSGVTCVLLKEVLHDSNDSFVQYANP